MKLIRNIAPQWAVSSSGKALFQGFFFLFFPVAGLSAQEASRTYFTDIQPIVQKHCVACHQPGGVAPFSLQEYKDVESHAEMMLYMTSAGLMPPWYADSLFQRYKNQRILPPGDVDILRQWIEQGKKKGKPVSKKEKQAPPASTPEPDLVLELDTPFVIPGNNREQFRLLVIPSPSDKNLYVRGMEYVPGSRALTHHVRLMLDTSHQVRRDHGKSVDEVPEAEQIRVPLADQFWYGWVPGNTAVFYDSGQAKLLPAGADIVLNVHYSPSPVPVADRPRLRIWLTEAPPQQAVKTFALGEEHITNPPFVILANSKPTFFLRSEVLQEDIYLISVLPHMHLLGKAFRAFAITPGGNMVPLVHISRWNFKWQTSYQFERPLRLPKGTVIYAEAQYDNTSGNPQNPVLPPRNVTYGWGTFNEMMNLVLEYVHLP
jgi:hypothetical protein